jgi:hypothetical protein
MSDNGEGEVAANHVRFNCLTQLSIRNVPVANARDGRERRKHSAGQHLLLPVILSQRLPERFSYGMSASFWNRKKDKLFAGGEDH